MIILWIFVFIHGIQTQTGVTPYEDVKLASIEAISDVAAFEDAEHRGPSWYNYVSDDSDESESETNSDSSQSSRFSDYTDSYSSSESSEASSFETRERRLATRVYRTCTPCPHDMMKKRTNIGIKWICAGYQRARRTFKSVCMMRYRNCEDGTMFVKLSDHRCKNDSYHGKHWFYVYRV